MLQIRLGFLALLLCVSCSGDDAPQALATPPAPITPSELIGAWAGTLVVNVGNPPVLDCKPVLNIDYVDDWRWSGELQQWEPVEGCNDPYYGPVDGLWGEDGRMTLFLPCVHGELVTLEGTVANYEMDLSWAGNCNEVPGAMRLTASCVGSCNP